MFVASRGKILALGMPEVLLDVFAGDGTGVINEKSSVA
jgi:hypothetical protein